LLKYVHDAMRIMKTLRALKQKVVYGSKREAWLLSAVRFEGRYQLGVSSQETYPLSGRITLHHTCLCGEYKFSFLPAIFYFSEKFCYARKCSS
jgi:hypothetical protein